MTPKQQLMQFLSRFSPQVATIARGVLRKFDRDLPAATRFVYNKNNALVIGFGPNERPSDAVLSIGVYRRWVNLYFLDGASLADEHGLLQGSGTRVRFVRLTAAADIDLPDVHALIAQALAIAQPAYPARGTGNVVIKQDFIAR
jgi:hypothetical protein